MTRVLEPEMKTDERDEFPGLDGVMGLQAPGGRERPAAATIALRE